MYYWFSWRANEEKVRRNGTLYFQWVDTITRKLVVYIATKNEKSVEKWLHMFLLKQIQLNLYIWKYLLSSTVLQA